MFRGLFYLCYSTITVIFIHLNFAKQLRSEGKTDRYCYKPHRKLLRHKCSTSSTDITDLKSDDNSKYFTTHNSIPPSVLLI